MKYSINLDFRENYLNQKYKEIYEKSIQNREEFWKDISKIFFGIKNQLKF